MLAACGGYANGGFMALLNEPLWFAIEVIEEASSLHSGNKKSLADKLL